jgi:hypothetical protein
VDAFDGAACEALLLRVRSTEDLAWVELVALLWPELLSFIRKKSTGSRCSSAAATTEPAW